jgi:Protein of unknown function, DUF488
VSDALTLHTASWTAVHHHSQAVGAGNEGFMPVRTSVGLPRFWPEARGLPVAKLLTPYGLRKLKGDEFRGAYLARLDETGVDAIRAELAEIALEYGGKPLALLCFEKSSSECHRSMFAAFWQEHTGEVVTEVGPALSTDPARRHADQFGRQCGQLAPTARIPDARQAESMTATTEGKAP